MRTIIPFALIALCAACGGSDGPGTGPISAADAHDGCQSSCEHGRTCDPSTTQTLEECTAACVADVQGWVRADAFEDIIACQNALACDATGNSCLAECAPTATHEEYETQCRKVFATCGTQEQIDGACETTPTGTGDAGFFCLIAPSIIDEMIACIPDGTGCNEGISCIQGVADAHHIDL